jgi:hypothetical protein
MCISDLVFKNCPIALAFAKKTISIGPFKHPNRIKPPGTSTPAAVGPEQPTVIPKRLRRSLPPYAPSVERTGGEMFVMEPNGVAMPLPKQPIDRMDKRSPFGTVIVGPKRQTVELVALHVIDMVVDSCRRIVGVSFSERGTHCLCESAGCKCAAE